MLSGGDLSIKKKDWNLYFDILNDSGEHNISFMRILASYNSVIQKMFFSGYPYVSNLVYLGTKGSNMRVVELALITNSMYQIG